MAKFKVIRNTRAQTRRRRTRNFFMLVTMSIFFAYTAYATYASRMQRLEEVQAERAAYEAHLDQIMLRQGYYSNQVVRLRDEDYIAMLARERHLMTLPNEILIRVVEDTFTTTEITDEYDENLSDTDGEISSIDEINEN